MDATGLEAHRGDRVPRGAARDWAEAGEPAPSGGRGARHLGLNTQAGQEQARRRERKGGIRRRLAVAPAPPGKERGRGALATESSGSTLYGPQQSRFARFLERREERRPDPGARELRRRLLAGLEGRVLEVGSGDGRSFEHYPPGVTALLAVEPDATARETAAERARTAMVPIEIADGLAERLPADDGSFDAVVVMGVLCSVADPRVVLQELRRVLREGGELRFWEHVRSRHVLFRTLHSASSTGSSGRRPSGAARRPGTPIRRSRLPGSTSSASSAAFTPRRSSRSPRRRTSTASPGASSPLRRRPPRPSFGGRCRADARAARTSSAGVAARPLCSRSCGAFRPGRTRTRRTEPGSTRPRGSPRPPHRRRRGSGRPGASPRRSPRPARGSSRPAGHARPSRAPGGSTRFRGRAPDSSRGARGKDKRASRVSSGMPESPVRELRVALTVKDYAEAVRFYRDVLGLPVSYEWDEDRERSHPRRGARDALVAVRRPDGLGGRGRGRTKGHLRPRPPRPRGRELGRDGGPAHGGGCAAARRSGRDSVAAPERPASRS